MRLNFKIFILSIFILCLLVCYSCNDTNNTYNHNDDYHWIGLNDTNKEIHDYYSWVVQSPTCSVEGIVAYKCKVCAHTYQDSIACVEHKINPAYYMDDESNTHYNICRVCNLRANEETHAYNQYQYNETNHTLVCVCGKQDVTSNHVFTETIKTEPDGIGSKGVLVFSCFCGYSYESEYDNILDKTDNLINNINKLTDDSTKEELYDLQDVYKSLPSYYQKLVTNYIILKNFITKLEEEANESVKAINTLINSIQEINSSVENVINQVDELYNKLSNEDKELISNYDLYLSIKAAFNEYDKYDYDSKSSYSQAVYNTAMNYYYQKTSIQYDQYNSKRNMLAEFNDATTEKWVYLDCSGFINSLYYMCFGQNIIPETYTYKSLISDNKAYRITISDSTKVNTENINLYALSAYQNKSSDLIAFVNCNDSSWTSKTESERIDYIKNDVFSSLEVGDIITYRHYSASSPSDSVKAYGSSGHIMMYIGNNQFIHCTGTCVNFTEGTTDPSAMITESQTSIERTKGAVLIDNLSVLYTSSSNRFLGDSKMSSFSVLRPIKNMTKLTTSGEAMVWNSCLNVEKTVSVGNYKNAVVGTNLEYDLCIDNTSSNIINYLFIKELLPTNTTFVKASNDGIYDNKTNTIYWRIGNIKKGETLHITYEVKPNDSIGKTVESYNTYVNNIRVNMLANPIVSSTVYKNINDNLVTAIAKLSNNTYDELYLAYIDIFKELGYNNILDNVTSDKYMITNTLAYYVLNSDAVLYNQVPSTLYGGNQIRANDPTNNNIMRIMYPSFLETGDIIVTHTTYSSETFEAYIYVNSSKIYKLTNNKLTLCYNTTSSVTEFVHTLPFYKRFVVIRPSLSIN